MYRLLYHGHSFLVPAVVRPWLPFSVPFALPPPPPTTAAALFTFQFATHIDRILPRLKDLREDSIVMRDRLTLLQEEPSELRFIVMTHDQSMMLASTDIERQRWFWTKLWLRIGGSPTDLAVVTKQITLAEVTRVVEDGM